MLLDWLWEKKLALLSYQDLSAIIPVSYVKNFAGNPALMARPTTAAKQNPAQRRTNKTKSVSVSDRRTDELVFGLIGPAGSGVSFCGRLLSDILKNEYSYDGKTISMSALINSATSYIDKSPVSADDEKRMSKLQTHGNSLRAKFGNVYLANVAIRDVNVNRGKPDALPTARRHFTILDSIKHPDEVSILREVYEDAFILIGVFAPEDVRKRRLSADGFNETYLAEVLTRDQKEGLPYGQNVTVTMELADFYVRNDGDNDGKPRAALNRYIEILFGIGVHTPTRDEHSMHHAKSISTGSACLSRQVGAVIMNNSGDIIGQGMNDVPKFGGGLYGAEDSENDNRCWKWKNKLCHNDNRKQKLLTKIETAVASSGALKKHHNASVRGAVSDAGVGHLIEFSRSVHAEMEAIISAARAGKPGLVGSTLYTTTFPCHSCARHIVASGISRVIYIEPYSKSLALELHSDSVSVNESDTGKKVVFLQYEGVAPLNVIPLFNQPGGRKIDGKLVTKARGNASPIRKAPLDGFSTREQIVVLELKNTETVPDSKDGEGDDDAPEML